MVRTGSELSALIKLQFPTGSLAVGAIYIPTGVAAAMRDLELVNLVSLIHLAKSWKIPLHLGGDWNGHIGNDHGGDDIHIGPFTSSTPTILKRFVFAHTFANEDLYLEDSFHSLVRRGTWRHNNGNWYENDVLWTDVRAHKTVSKVKCSHVSFSDHVVKRYSLNIGAGQGKIGARSIRERIFKINTRKIMETQKKLDRGALRGDSFNAIHNREAYSALCRKEFRPDLFNQDDPCTVVTSDKFNMEHKCKSHDEAMVGAERKVMKFFQTPVEIDEARTMSQALLNHRVQELRNLHGQEWILATDGSFDSKTNDPAGWDLFVLSPSGICWLFSGSTEIERDMEMWHGEEDHTNNTSEMKAMLAAHVFIQHLQHIAGWQEARHEAPVQRLRDAQNVTIPGQEWLDSLPNTRKQEPYDFILRALIEQLINSGQRTISIAKLNMKKRIVFDSEIAGFAAMGTRQVTNHVKLASVLQTLRRQIRRKEEIYMRWTPRHSKHLGNEMADGLAHLGSKGTSFCPAWMKMAFRRIHKKATEIDTKEPTQEFTLQQHKGWSGYRDFLITAAEKVIDRGKQPVVGLPYSMESLCEIQRRRRLLDKKLIWTRQAQGVDEIKRRKQELNSMRSEFNAYSWKARKEWANKKVIDLQRAKEFHDLGAIHRILRETGLSVEKTFSAKAGNFARLMRQPHILKLEDKTKR